jgi:hypothetical protein
VETAFGKGFAGLLSYSYLSAEFDEALARSNTAPRSRVFGSADMRDQWCELRVRPEQ